MLSFVLLQALPASLTSTPIVFSTYLVSAIPFLLTAGWLLVVFMVLWVVWSTYMLLKQIEYISAIQWSFLQITLPEDSEYTPKAMEVAFDVWGGLHKNPDLIEKYFDGYTLAWYTCELQCTMGKARYIMVVPTVHRRFFEGVIYGQYPSAEVKEVEDYTQRFQYQDNGKTFNMYGTEMLLSNDDHYPIRTYVEYEDKLAPEDRFIDPHSSLIEAYTNVGPGEEYWVQICIRPIDFGEIDSWAKKGYEMIAEISGQAPKEKPGFLENLKSSIFSIPSLFLAAFNAQELPASAEDDDKPSLRFFNPSDNARMEGILHKVSRGSYRVKIRVIYIAPLGQLHKPNISRAIGAFKQFNTYHLNGLKPDPDTKTNGPNFFFKATRRAFLERSMLLNFQWRDFWGDDSGQMYNAEELATLYHFPVKYIKAPGVERAKSGMQGAPDNLPYV